MDYEKLQSETYRRLKNPKVGDIFSECFSYWMEVYRVSRSGKVTILEAEGLREFPSKAEFLKYFCYSYIPETPWLQWAGKDARPVSERYPDALGKKQPNEKRGKGMKKVKFNSEVPVNTTKDGYKISEDVSLCRNAQEAWELNVGRRQTRWSRDLGVWDLSLAQSETFLKALMEVTGGKRAAYPVAGLELQHTPEGQQNFKVTMQVVGDKRKKSVRCALSLEGSRWAYYKAQKKINPFSSFQVTHKQLQQLLGMCSVILE